MKNMGKGVLPHITNGLIFAAILSAGNTYTYCAVRSLHGMALEGRAPRVLAKTNKNGVHIYCLGFTMLFPLLAYLQLGNGSMVVLQWLINLVTAGCVINYIVIGITYIFFYRACKTQGVYRKNFPYVGWIQPYGAILGLSFTTFVVLFYGSSSFTPWDVGTFFSYYAMVMVGIVTYSGWKIFKRSKVVPAMEADLVGEAGD